MGESEGIPKKDVTLDPGVRDGLIEESHIMYGLEIIADDGFIL